MERITSKISGLWNGNQSFFKSYEKSNHASFLDYLKTDHKKFGKISVIINRASQHTSNGAKKYLKKNNVEL